MQQARELAARLDADELEARAGDDPEIVALLQTFSRLQILKRETGSATWGLREVRTPSARKPWVPTQRARWGFSIPPYRSRLVIVMAIILLLIAAAASAMLPSARITSIVDSSDRFWDGALMNPTGSAHSTRSAPIAPGICPWSDGGSSTDAAGSFPGAGHTVYLRRAHVSVIVKDLTASMSRVSEIVSEHQGQLLGVALTHSKQTQVRAQVPLHAVQATILQINALGTKSTLSSSDKREPKAYNFCTEVHVDADNQVLGPAEGPTLAAEPNRFQHAQDMVQIDICLFGSGPMSLLSE